MRKYADLYNPNGHKRETTPPYFELPLGDKLLVMLSKLSHLSRSAFDGKSSQNRILHLLSDEGAMTQRELTEHLGIQPGSASEVMKKLENAGLISRTVSESDRRAVDVCLTANGVAQAEEYMQQRTQRINEMFSCLSADEQQQLLSFLERLGENWSQRYRGEGRRRQDCDNCSDETKDNCHRRHDKE